MIRLSGHAVVGLLYVDCRNVIGQQHNFVGVQLITILQGQHVRRDESAFHHADGERPGSREGVKNVDALILETATEVFLQRLVRTADDEIHHLNRRVDDAEAFHHLGKGRLEKLVIQLHNELLPCRGVFDAFDPFPDAGIKAFQRIKVFFQSLPFQHVQNSLHGLRNRIVFRKGIAFKQRVKNRFGDDVLCQHLYGLFPVNGRIQVAAQALNKGVKGGLLFVGRLFQHGTDTHLMPFRNAGNVLCPRFPILPVTALVDNLPVNGILPFPELL